MPCTDGNNLQLTIAGDKLQMENLIYQRDALNLQNNIHLIGESDDVITIMKSADLFVLPSINEPFGIVLLEAMASGLPIVATNSNGSMEIFDDSSAILVDTRSGAALSKGIQTAMLDPEATFQRARIA